MYEYMLTNVVMDQTQASYILDKHSTIELHPDAKHGYFDLAKFCARLGVTSLSVVAI